MDVSASSSFKLDFNSAVPMYLQIAEYLAAQIRQQFMPPAMKLPPERQLADQLGVSRTTAINAYRKLEEQGLVITKVGSGTYVSDVAPEEAIHPVPWHQMFAPYSQGPLAGIIRDLVSVDISDGISLSTGLPDPRLYPTKAFTRLFNERSHQLNNLDLGHIPTEGYQPLRTALASLMSQKSIPGTADNVAIVSGSQQGLYLLTKIFLNPGDYVIAESPTYLGALPIFRAAGARVLSLPAPGPLQLDLLTDYLVRYRPKLLYIMPTYQNPSGRVLSTQERQALLALAARHRLVIIEDDPYGALHYDQQPPPSLKTLDHYGGVIYLGTFSKILFPGLRLGWVAAPEAVINRLALEKQYVDLHSANLSQWLLHEFLAEGLLAPHLELIRKTYGKRRDTLANALKRHCGSMLSFTNPAGGFYFWCKITQPGVSSRSLLQEATRLGVNFVPGEAFYNDAEGEREFRLCFATNDEESLAEGAKRLAKAFTLAARNFPGEVGKAGYRVKPII